VLLFHGKIVEGQRSAHWERCRKVHLLRAFFFFFYLSKRLLLFIDLPCGSLDAFLPASSTPPFLLGLMVVGGDVVKCNFETLNVSFRIEVEWWMLISPAAPV
jgi:hypothetical protein